VTFRQAVGDFFAPFFRVRFIDSKALDAGQVAYGSDGEELPSVASADVTAELINSGDVTSFRVGENDQMSQLRSYATSFEVTTEGGAHTIAKLHMEPMIEDAINIIDSEAIQWNALMVAEWGYLDTKAGLLGENKYSKTGVFVIQKPSLDLSEDGAQIDIIGVDVFGLTLTKRETRRKWDRNGDYKTDLSIIQELIDRNGMSLDATQVGLAPAGLGAVAGAAGAGGTHSLETEHPIKELGEPEVLEQNESDWTFFQRIVMNNNCTFYTQGTTVFLVDMNEAKGAQANYRLMMYMQPQNDTDIPMESFSTGALPTLFWPPEAKGTKAVTVNPDTNEVKNAAKTDEAETGTFDPSTAEDNKNLGPQTSGGQKEADGRTVSVEGSSVKPNPKYEENQTGKGFYMAWGTPNREEASKQNARWKALKSGVNAQVTIPGTPAVETMQIVEVMGVGKVMSGFYLVTKATHTINTGGYQTTLELVREASSGDTVAGKGTQPTAQANPDSAEGGASGDTTLPIDGTL
jgi:hypothetical protein